MNITINSKKEYYEIIKYFKFQNIEVKKKVKYYMISHIWNLKYDTNGGSCCGGAETNLTSIHKDVSSFPGLTQ